jgi:hypothetical protein
VEIGLYSTPNQSPRNAPTSSTSTWALFNRFSKQLVIISAPLWSQRKLQRLQNHQDHRRAGHQNAKKCPPVEELKLYSSNYFNVSPRFLVFLVSARAWPSALQFSPKRGNGRPTCFESSKNLTQKRKQTSATVALGASHKNEEEPEKSLHETQCFNLVRF